jgi:hypothetical protein
MSSSKLSKTWLTSTASRALSSSHPPRCQLDCRSDYDDYDDIKNDDEQYYNDSKDKETKDQLKQYEQSNPEEIGDIIQNARLNINPNVHEETTNATQQQLVHPEEPHERAGDKESQAAEPTRRSTRETKPIEWLEPKMSGKSYMQQKKNGIFKSDVDVQSEYCHNLVTRE